MTREEIPWHFDGYDPSLDPKIVLEMWRRIVDNEEGPPVLRITRDALSKLLNALDRAVNPPPPLWRQLPRPSRFTHESFVAHDNAMQTGPTIRESSDDRSSAFIVNDHGQICGGYEEFCSALDYFDLLDQDDEEEYD